MMKKFLSLFIILFFVLAHKQALAENNYDKQNQATDSLLESLIQPKSPGFVVGIIKEGEFIYKRGFGLANIERNEPITTTTVFDIASTSKQFTGMALLLLQQEGELSLDDNVRKYIPELPKFKKPITIRHLLTHTSGYRDYGSLFILSGLDESDVTTREDALQIICAQKSLHFPTGSSWDYTNTGFFLASILVERVSGLSLEEYTLKNIFEPLGMSHTFFLEDRMTVIPNKATGYGRNDENEFIAEAFNWHVCGAGGLQTTCEDLLLWDQNFYSPTVGGPTLIQELTQVVSLYNGYETNYGLGIFNEKYKGLQIQHHDGGIPGYRSEMIRFPSESFTVIFLSNFSAYEPTEIALEISEIYLKEKLIEPAKDTSASHYVEVKLTLPQLQSYTGYYRTESGDLVRQIALENDVLWYVRNDWNKSELVYIGQHEFLMKEDGTLVKFSLETDSIQSIDVISKGQNFAHLIPFSAMTIDSTNFADVLGSYFSEEINSTLELYIENSSLFITSKNSQIRIELQCMIADNYSNTENGLTIQIERNKKNDVTGLFLNIDRAVQNYFVRI